MYIFLLYWCYHFWWIKMYILVIMPALAISHQMHSVWPVHAHMCTWSYTTTTKIFLARYLTNCGWEFHQTDNFGALGDKDGPIIVLKSKGQRSRSQWKQICQKSTLGILKVIGSKLTTFPARAYWLVIQHCGSFITKTRGLECMPLFDIRMPL